MAHPVTVKAQALSLLLLGNSTRYTAEQTGVPLTTVKRWNKEEAKPLLREIFAGMGLQRPIKMAPKKGQGR